MPTTLEQQSIIRVLIVEDNDAQRRILTDLIRDEGFEPVACCNANEALVEADCGKFDVAILDQRLPEMTGTELLGRLQKMQHGLKAIIHTAYGSFESAKDAVNLGAFAYVEKLGHPEELVLKVHQAAQLRMVEALQRSEAQYGHLIESVQAIVWRSDPRTSQFHFVSPEAEKILGYAVDEWLNTPSFWRNQIHVEDRDWVVALCNQATAERRPHELEYRMIAADGRVVWLHEFVTVHVEQGQVSELIGVMVDVTEQKRIAEALRKSEESLNKAQHIAHIGNWELDLDTDTLVWSDEMFRIHGLEPTGFAGDVEAFLATAVHPDDQAGLQAVLQQALGTCGSFTCDYRILCPDGRERIVSAQGHVLCDQGQPMRMVGVVQDITERKHLEKELLEISNREQRRIGQDLHDGLGQLLTGIGFRVAELEGDLQKAGLPIAEDAAEIGQMVERAIVQTRGLAHGLDPINVEQQGLTVALDALTRSIETIYGIVCVFVCPDPFQVHDPEVAIQVYRIAQESITNALKHAQAARVNVALTRNNGQAKLAVSDDGIGLPMTSPRPIGMGMRIMDYRARMIGGTIDVDSRPTGGTVVTCSFPYTSVQEPVE